MCEHSGAGENGAFDLASLCRNASELSPQPMIAVEGATHIVRYLNLAFARLVGKSRNELLGRPFNEAVPEGENNGCLALFDRVYHSGVPETLAEQQHGQTPPIYWSYSVWPILGANYRPIGVMIQVTDTTETAVFRQKVVAMNERLLLLGARQHELTQVAERANQLKDEFLATLSHELRTPLTAILGWADTLGRPGLDADISRRAIEIIRRNARIQVNLINDLLDTSSLVTGKLRLQVRPVDLKAVILAATEGLRPAASAKEIALRLQLDALDEPVFGDPDRLQQVMWHLVSNALKFTPQGGRVTVGLKRVDSHLEVSVSDTGVGIAPDVLPYVFDRFRQADATSTRAFGGVGVGLSLVRQLIELHGGTVRASSRGENGGTTFALTLQLVAAPVDEKETFP